MGNFPHWWVLEGKITLGELLTALTAASAAWWVGHVIQRRNATDLAMRDLLVSLCGQALAALSTLADSIEACSLPGDATLDASIRHRIVRELQIFSNSIHSLEAASKRVPNDRVGSALAAVKTRKDDLRAQTSDPLAEVQ